MLLIKSHICRIISQNGRLFEKSDQKNVGTYQRKYGILNVDMKFCEKPGSLKKLRKIWSKPFLFKELPF